jgi:hypothetical protein
MSDLEIQLIYVNLSAWYVIIAPVPDCLRWFCEYFTDLLIYNILDLVVQFFLLL